MLQRDHPCCDLQPQHMHAEHMCRQRAMHACVRKRARCVAAARRCRWHWLKTRGGYDYAVVLDSGWRVPLMPDLMLGSVATFWVLLSYRWAVMLAHWFIAPSSIAPTNAPTLEVCAALCQHCVRAATVRAALLLSAHGCARCARALLLSGFCARLQHPRVQRCSPPVKAPHVCTTPLATRRGRRTGTCHHSEHRRWVSVHKTARAVASSPNSCSGRAAGKLARTAANSSNSRHTAASICASMDWPTIKYA